MTTTHILGEQQINVQWPQRMNFRFVIIHKYTILLGLNIKEASLLPMVSGMNTKEEKQKVH
jgi:hypothetical protein